MSDYPDFITARRLEELRKFNTDEQIIAFYKGTLVYAGWELGKSVYELRRAIWAQCEPFFDWLFDRPRLVITLYWGAALIAIAWVILGWRT